MLFLIQGRKQRDFLSTEGDKQNSGAENGIHAVITNASAADNFDRRESSNGKFFFNLLAQNKQIIGSSQMHSNAASRDKGIAAVVKASGVAEIKDLMELPG